MKITELFKQGELPLVDTEGKSVDICVNQIMEALEL